MPSLKRRFYEARLTAHEARLTAHEARLTAHEARLTAHEARLTAYEATPAVHEAALRAMKQSPFRLHVQGKGNSEIQYYTNGFRRLCFILAKANASYSGVKRLATA